MAVTALSLPRPTFFAQFKLVHQIPEMLALYCLSQFESLRRAGTPVEELVSVLGIGADLIDLMNECVNMLLIHLYPVHYHQIRANLGATSGSHSDAIGRRLFKEDAVWLSERVAELLDGDELEGAISLALRQAYSLYRERTLLWRDLHLGLPRNVLGGFGVKSLIGSPDAVETAYRMRNASVGGSRERTDGELADLVPTRNATIGPAEALDRRLLEITADQTRSRFPDVQNRTGPTFGAHEKDWDGSHGRDRDD